MVSYIADFYIDSDVLDWATKEDCPSIFNEYVAHILIDALHINGVPHVFCKCVNGGYNLSWILNHNGEEYIRTFSENELLNALKNKSINYEIKVE